MNEALSEKTVADIAWRIVNHSRETGAAANCVLVHRQLIGELREALQSQSPVETSAPYSIPEVLSYLTERAAWLKKEWQNGGDYAYLHLKQEECEYIASCIKDTSERANAVKATAECPHDTPPGC